MRCILGKFLAIAAVMCVSFHRSPSPERDSKSFFLKVSSWVAHCINFSRQPCGFGLSSNNPGFLFEFEVALKSVLLNAPLKRDLFVHILADQDSFQALDDIDKSGTCKNVMTMNIGIGLSGYYLHPEWQTNRAKVGLYI